MDLNKIAKKWQEKWEKSKIFEVKEDSKKKKLDASLTGWTTPSMRNGRDINDGINV